MTDVEQVVVVVPAHNELEHLPNCLCALTTAALCLPAPVLIVVVRGNHHDDLLDICHGS